jgi:hypothetical protein
LKPEVDRETKARMGTGIAPADRFLLKDPTGNGMQE